jgi:hypothetical protein
VVEPHWNFQAIFEKQIMVADSHRSPEKPDIFVCDAQRRLPLPGEGCARQLVASLAEGYVPMRVGEVVAAARPALQSTMQMCLRR